VATIYTLSKEAFEQENKQENRRNQQCKNKVTYGNHNPQSYIAS
jgi:hypothetical protein